MTLVFDGGKSTDYCCLYMQSMFFKALRECKIDSVSQNLVQIISPRVAISVGRTEEIIKSSFQNKPMLSSES